jgi:hypothetical protein
MKQLFVAIALLSPVTACVPADEPTPSTASFALGTSLDAALDAWNAQYRGLATAVATTSSGPIADDAARTGVIRTIAGGRFPDFLPAHPRLVSLAGSQLDEIVAVLDGQIQVGDDAYAVRWDAADGTQFETTAVVAPGGQLRWESLTGFAFSGRRLPIDSTSAGADWIWGGERGRFDAEVEAICDENGRLKECKTSCTSSMQIGTADHQCSVIKGETCCTLVYGYALKTPLVDAEFEAEKDKNGNVIKIKVKVSGVGSCVNGSGQLVDCCKAR